MAALINDIIGTYPSGSDVHGASGDISFLIPEAYYDGTKSAIASDSNLLDHNIKSGEVIFGVTGTYTGSGTDPFLLPANLKTGITIFGVTSNMPLVTDTNGIQ